MMEMRMVERGKGGLVMEDERVDGGQQGMLTVDGGLKEDRCVLMGKTGDLRRQELTDDGGSKGNREAGGDEGRCFDIK